MDNAFTRLRQQNLAKATRPFCARGTSVVRCDRCQLQRQACICPWRVNLPLAVDTVLLLHHDEIFKPTNTGRLLAELFPQNTWAFEWSRTEPAQGLLDLLADPQRHCVLVFPSAAAPDRSIISPDGLTTSGRRPTLILLDGTWKQAGKMMRSSHWLSTVPLLAVDVQVAPGYGVRKAPRSGQLATAEAAACALTACGETLGAQALADYFAVFNQHYLALRQNRPPDTGTQAHRRLQNLF